MSARDSEAYRIAKRWAAQVRRSRTQPDKRRAAHKTCQALLVAINGEVSDKTHPLELARK